MEAHTGKRFQNPESQILMNPKECVWLSPHVEAFSTLPKTPLSAALRFFGRRGFGRSFRSRCNRRGPAGPPSGHLRREPRSFGTHTALRCPLPRCGRHFWPTCRAAMPSCPGRSSQSQQDGYRHGRRRRQLAAGSAKMCPAGMSGNCRFTIST